MARISNLVVEHLDPAKHPPFDDFSCGEPACDAWLRDKAVDCEGRVARTYIARVGHEVVGFYEAAFGALLVSKRTMPADVDPEQLLVPNQLPAVVVGHLAVKLGWQRQGLGTSLFRDAAVRAIAASQHVGVRYLILRQHGDDTGEAFLRKLGLTPSADNPRAWAVLLRELFKMEL